MYAAVALPLIFMVLAFTPITLMAQPSSNNAPESEANVVKLSPSVKFPTKQQVLNYIKDHREPVSLSNPLLGNVTDQQVAISGNTTWVGWLGNVNGTNNVFLTVSVDGGNSFLPPANVTVLSGNQTGNASNLSVGASSDGKEVYAVWKGTNQNGTNMVFYSSSMDSGKEFKTYPISSPNVEAVNPKLTVEGNNLLVTWIVKIRNLVTGDDPCSSDYPGTNQNGTTISGDFTVMCSHSRRW
jgi:hypothetical protein